VTVWLLLDANRWLLAGGVVLTFCLVLVGASALTGVDLRTVLGQSDPVETLFQALITAIITGVTLVVTIAQLVLSQELGAVGDQRERMEGAMAFRRDTEELLDAAVAPAEPAAFLGALADAAGARADDLCDTVAGAPDEHLRESVRSFAESLADSADRVGARLDDAEFGTFEVVVAALDFDYSGMLHEARRLQGEHGDDLPAEASDALGEITETLRLFGPAREHVKTLYFQWELSNLSRAVLYAAVPSLAVAVWGVLFLEAPGTVTGTTLGIDNLVWAVSAATALSLAPFALLGAYVLRIVTVTKRTLAIGPFVLRETDRSGDERNGT
jgi:hypothetical protein